ncbi:MAG: PA14 domain-containing protein, partial [Candidatus Omnitrophica bacterium]|nr:PA14 domain-containing protein [Candidatus Omnitrophota bacterium]
YFLWIYFYQEGQWSTYEIAQNTLPVFLAKVNNFVEGIRFWPDNPVLSAERYHDFGFPLFTALFVATGVPITSLLSVMGIACAIIVLLTLCLWAGWVGLAGFLCLGGTAGIFVILTNLGHHMGTFLSQEIIYYAALPFMIFLSQPEFWYVFPAGIFLVWCWRLRFLEKQPLHPDWAEIILWGTMPLFHLHTFLLLSFIFMLWAIVARRIRDAAVILSRVSPVALPLLLIFTGFGRDLSVLLQISPVKILREKDCLFFYLKNYGYFLPWFLWGFNSSIRSKRKDLRAVVWPALVLFAFLIFFEVSFWVGENLPWIAWCYVLLLYGFRQLTLERLKPFSRACFFGFLFMPGFLLHMSSTTYLHKRVPVISEKSVEEVQKAVRPLAREWRMATTMTRNHAVALCGYPVVSLFNDTTFVQNSPLMKNSQKLRALMAGKPEWMDVAGQLNVRYIYWGSGEKKDFDYYSLRPWEGAAKEIRRESWGSIYDIGNQSLVLPLPDPGQGLTASFYASKTFQGQVLMKKRVRTINFSWKEADREVLCAPFGIVFEGEIYIPETGDITFYLASDDGSDLTINNDLIIDHLRDHPLRIKAGRRFLEKGWYPIRVRFYNSWGIATIQFWWKLPSGVEDFVPSQYFRPPK